MKITDEQKQLLLACTAATTDMTAALAAAGTLCIYAEADAILLGRSWHKQLHLLSLSFQQALENCYTQETNPS